MTYTNIAVAYSQSLEYMEKALVVQERVLGPYHPDTAVSYGNLGGEFGNMRDNKKALFYFNKALQAKLKSLGPDHPDVAVTYGNLGDTYHNLHQYDLALELFNKALKIQIKALGPESPLWPCHTRTCTRRQRRAPTLTRPSRLRRRQWESGAHW